MDNSRIDNKIHYDKNGFINIEIKRLIDWKEPNGEGCIVSDEITKVGWKVGYMYRDEPMEEWPDSGRFIIDDGLKQIFIEKQDRVL